MYLVKTDNFSSQVSAARSEPANSQNLFASNTFDPDFSHNLFCDKHWESGRESAMNQVVKATAFIGGKMGASFENLSRTA